MKKILIGVIAGLAITSFAAGAAYLHYFTDVPKGRWYTNAVEFLASEEIVSGYDDGTFGPRKEITRAEVSIMLMNAMSEMGHAGAVCLTKPKSTDIGRPEYPVAHKYEDIYWLGSIFTAMDCGLDRLDELFGGHNAEYSWGSVLSLYDAPSGGLYEALLTAGFACQFDDVETTKCQNWQLDDEVQIGTLLPLRMFYREFKSDGCVNCG